MQSHSDRNAANARRTIPVVFAPLPDSFLLHVAGRNEQRVRF